MVKNDEKMRWRANHALICFGLSYFQCLEEHWHDDDVSHTKFKEFASEDCADFFKYQISKPKSFLSAP